MADKEKTKRSLRPEFIKWSDRTDPVRGTYKAMDWVDMSEGAVPKYTLLTDGGLVSFLGTTQLVEAFDGLRFGADVEVIKLEEGRTSKNRRIFQFEVNVYEDEPGEADKKLAEQEALYDQDGQDATEEGAP